MRRTGFSTRNNNEEIRCRRAGHAFCAATGGQSLIETAISLSLLLICTITVVGFSEAAYAKHFTAAAARQATRYAIVRGSTFTGVSCSTTGYGCQATAADIQKFVTSRVPSGLSVKAVSVVVTWPGLAASGLACLTLNGTNSPGCDVQVTVKYTFRYALPFLPRSVSTFQSTSTVAIVQ